MTRLFISIIIAVLGSLFLIGWGLDKLVVSDSDIDIEESAEIIAYKKLVEGFGQQLNAAPENLLAKQAAELAANYQVKLTLEDSTNIALPNSLSQYLSVQGGLLLASNEQAYLLRKLSTHQNYLIRLELPPIPEEDHQRNLLLTTILYIGVCAILMLWLFPLARRLYMLTTAAAKIGKGEVNVRVPLNKFSYIHPLEKSFNHMAAQIEKLMADNKLLARSLSHDIRTPMSCLRFGVEAALESNDLEKKNNYLTRMEAELTRMEEMTSAFLSYAGMERQGVNLKLKSVDLNSFISKFCQDFQPLAQQHQVELNFQSLAQCPDYLLDSHWFYQALQNLVSNAIQYANSQVQIRLTQTGRTIELWVEDDGTGIADDKLAVVFDPFVKLDSARSREQGHFGLGLAICQKVIHWHQGAIYAEHAKQLSGACFHIILPKKA
ncbi:two-component sensor histidine kinase [Thalassotalea insulae]|uniref:histidine kinase n=1 Tax=Thalassotalea insulae TaxID=2056778 RepID=A0ABQ6GR51_9GAMM|nr:ATP-binding protein [Thalassotalea insulae]GLX77824.1 two-component sensor histidine kinase [Thalassotalea insulae]